MDLAIRSAQTADVLFLANTACMGSDSSWQKVARRITLTSALILWAMEDGHQSSSSWCELKWPRK